MFKQSQFLNLLLALTISASWVAPGICQELNLSALNQFVKEGKFIQAEDEAQRLLMLYPRAADVHYAYGNLLKTCGQSDLAYYEFSRANELAPNNPKSSIALSEICLQNLDLDNALLYAEQAVSADPNLLSSRITLLSVLLKSEQITAAEKELTYLTEKTGDNAELAIIASKLYLKKRDYKTAQHYLESALAKTDKQNPALKLELAEIYGCTGDYKKEYDTLYSLVQLNPFINEARLRLAHNLEIQKHDYDAAADQYKEVLKTNSMSEEALSGLQRCQIKKQDIALRLRTALRNEWSKIFSK